MRIDRELFRTGIPLIDNQHEAYLYLVDELFELCMDPDCQPSAVHASIVKLLSFAVDHFDAEEFLMQGTGYPRYAAHRAKHDEFRNQIDTLSTLCTEATSKELVMAELREWLVDWFSEQTETHDRRLARFLKKVICDGDHD